MAQEVSNEVVPTAQSVSAKIANMNAGEVGVYSTFKGEDFKTRVQVAQALSAAQPISDFLGETINLANVVVQAVDVADEDGTLNEAVRVILVDDKGKSYAALSDGLYRSLQNLFGVLGEPSTWPEPLPVRVVEEKSRKGFKFFTIQIV